MYTVVFEKQSVCSIKNIGIVAGVLIIIARRRCLAFIIQGTKLNINFAILRGIKVATAQFFTVKYALMVNQVIDRCPNGY